MKTKFTETIDGSIKSILQLKTLDNSLEFSQMFDALQDTPRDFQFKLMDALNSLGQTMEIPPIECFDKVLCASDDENPDIKKKMYNWWRAFFEVLGKTRRNLPNDRSTEFTEKVDALMAEIMKSGDKEASTDNEVVLEDFEQVKEDYEEADKAEENEMNKDFDFAVQQIGEIANKVKDIVNFVNPYCESVWGTNSMNENEVRKFVKSIGFRSNPDGIDYETQLVDALTGKDTSYNAGWNAVYYNSDKVLQYLKKYGMLGSRGIKQKEAISKLKRLFKTGKWRQPEQQEGGGDLYNEVENTMKKTNERGGSDWVSMDDIIGMEVGESDEEPINWDDEDTYNDGGFERGMWVIWTDPDTDEESVWKILRMPKAEDETSYDNLFVIGQKNGDKKEVPGWEIRPRDADPEEYKGDNGETFWKAMDDVDDLERKDHWSGEFNEASVVVDVNDVWDVLDLLDDEVANKNLTDLINSHVRTEEEIMDAIDELFPGDVTKSELNKFFVDPYVLVTTLGLDGKEYKTSGGFVDPQKPVTLEGSDDEQKPDEVKDGEKKYKKDGETKTLVTGEKNLVSEMTIEQEITDPWKLLNLLWGQGKENFEELLRSNLFSDDRVMDTLEQFEIKDLTNLNDFLAFEFEQFLEALGCDPEAWTQHLEIQRK